MHRGDHVLGLAAAQPLVADQEHIGERRRRALAGAAPLLHRTALQAAADGLGQRLGAGGELPLRDRAFDGDRQSDDREGHDRPHGVAAVAHQVPDRAIHA
jgi:hypothetical protein